MSKIQLAYQDNHGKITAIRDENGVLWTWGPNNFYAVACLDEEEWIPDTGYSCEPFNVEEAADILLEGGYINKQMHALLCLLNMDW